jgi:FAD/FMN-containing dehydrogenase
VPDKKQWELMWGIKKTFDPNNILSPGVGLPPNLHGDNT